MGRKHQYYGGKLVYGADFAIVLATTGEQIGYDRSKVEERQSIALNMLKYNFPLEMIARFTGLTVVQLQQLQTESQHG